MSFIKLLSYIIPTYKICGRVAQLVEHYLDMVVVVGSSPIVATIFTKIISSFYLIYNFKTLHLIVLVLHYFLNKLLYSCIITSVLIYIAGE